MKRFIFSGLSLLLLSVAAGPAVVAGEVTLNPGTQNQTTIPVQSITPFDLVTRAFNGEFEDQGIPGGIALIDAHNYHRIEAEDLVKGAINEGRLTIDMLEDEGYLHAVEMQLEAQEESRD